MFQESRIHVLLSGRLRTRTLVINPSAGGLTVQLDANTRNSVRLLQIIGIEIKSSWWLELFGLSQLQLFLETQGRRQRFRCCVGSRSDIEALSSEVTNALVRVLVSVVGSVRDFADQFEASLALTLTPNRYVRGSRYKAFLDEQIAAHSKISVNLETLNRHPYTDHIPETTELLKRITRIAATIGFGDSIRQTHNDEVIARQADEYAPYFASVESSPLSPEQIRASLGFDDANLTIAAAGSGKSSVIVSKAGFALKTGLFSEDEILVLAFNADAVDELRKRMEKVSKQLGRRRRVKVRTFHSIGFHLWRAKHKGDIRFRRPQLINFQERSGRALIVQTLQHLVETNPPFADALLQWVSSYRYPSPEPALGVGLNEADVQAHEKRYEDLCKAACLSNRSGTPRKSYEAAIPTLNPAKFVRSFEEARIFNWLYLRDVQFEYEPTAPSWLTANMNQGIPVEQQVKHYHPDFSYPHPTEANRSFFHEHFGINGQGQAPKFMGGQSYVARANHKRHVFKESFRSEDQKARVSRFFETTSADFADGTIFKKLANELTKRGIAVGEINADKKTKALASICGDDSPLIDDLITPFVALYRDSGLTFDELHARISMSGSNPRIVGFFRLMLTLDIALRKRLGGLADNGSALIDFSAMITEATQFLKESGDVPSVKTKFVLVDEFQDIARSRAQLVQALLDQYPDESMLYCVGDDWQAINRFAGSDLAIFRSLYNASQGSPLVGSDHPIKVRSTDLTLLGTTYRCDQGIADIAKTFVMSGSKGLHIDKPAMALRSATTAIVRVVEHGDDKASRLSALHSALDRLAGLPPLLDDRNGLPRVADVLVLTRNRKDGGLPDGLSQSALGSIESAYSHRLKVKWHTLHTAKGLGADYVVIAGLV